MENDFESVLNKLTDAIEKLSVKTDSNVEALKMLSNNVVESARYGKAVKATDASKLRATTGSGILANKEAVETLLKATRTTGGRLPQDFKAQQGLVQQNFPDFRFITKGFVDAIASLKGSMLREFARSQGVYFNSHTTDNRLRGELVKSVTSTGSGIQLSGIEAQAIKLQQQQAKNITARKRLGLEGAMAGNVESRADLAESKAMLNLANVDINKQKTDAAISLFKGNYFIKGANLRLDQQAHATNLLDYRKDKLARDSLLSLEKHEVAKGNVEESKANLSFKQLFRGTGADAVFKRSQVKAMLNTPLSELNERFGLTGTTHKESIAQFSEIRQRELLDKMMPKSDGAEELKEASSKFSESVVRAGLTFAGAVGSAALGAGVQYAGAIRDINTSRMGTSFTGGTTNAFAKSLQFRSREIEAAYQAGGSLISGVGGGMGTVGAFMAGTGAGVIPGVALMGAGALVSAGGSFFSGMGTRASVEERQRLRERYYNSSVLKGYGLNPLLSATDVDNIAPGVATRSGFALGGNKGAGGFIANMVANGAMLSSLGVGMGNVDMGADQAQNLLVSGMSAARMLNRGGVVNTLRSIQGSAGRFGTDAVSIAQLMQGSQMTSRDVSADQMATEFGYSLTRPGMANAMTNYNNMNFIDRTVTDSILKSMTGYGYEDFATGKAGKVDAKTLETLQVIDPNAYAMAKGDSASALDTSGTKEYAESLLNSNKAISENTELFKTLNEQLKMLGVNLQEVNGRLVMVNKDEERKSLTHADFMRAQVQQQQMFGRPMR